MFYGRIDNIILSQNKWLKNTFGLFVKQVPVNNVKMPLH